MSAAAARQALEGLLERVDLGGLVSIAPEVVQLAYDDRTRLHSAYVEATAKAIHGWLGNWSILASGARPAGELKAKAIAYADLLRTRYPMGVFSTRSCEAMARRFSELPSFAEICAFLDEEMVAIRERDRRLGLVAKTKPAAQDRPKRYNEYSPEERVRIDAMFQQMYDNLQPRRRRP